MYMYMCVQKQSKKEEAQIEHLQQELTSQTAVAEVYKQKSKERKLKVSFSLSLHIHVSKIYTAADLNFINFSVRFHLHRIHFMRFMYMYMHA